MLMLDDDIVTYTATFLTTFPTVAVEVIVRVVEPVEVTV